MPVVRKTVVVSNPQGLHARPAELFSRLALQFEADIEVIRDDLRIDAKSILNVLTLGAAQGATLVIEARGADAEKAIDALERLVVSDFKVGDFNTDELKIDETLSQESSG
ncbi:MAG: HPr family phosphocarrier protein [Pirellulales bacterium]